MPATKAFPEIEVAKHTSTSSCWMIIENKVYDVTPFLQEHPGGEDILLDSSGRDATREFEDVGHSDEARDQLEALYVGELREPTNEEKASAEEDVQRGATVADGGGNSVVATLAKWLLPVVLIGFAYVLRNYS